MTIMMTTNFSEIKKQEIRVSKFGRWERNKGFWPEYLLLIMTLAYAEIVLQTMWQSF